jgi:hypothetical protein
MLSRYVDLPHDVQKAMFDAGGEERERLLAWANDRQAWLRDQRLNPRKCFSFHRIDCGCGVRVRRGNRASRCEACQAARALERRRAGQRERRAIKAGLLGPDLVMQDGRILYPAIPAACLRCGESFTPKRTTARFCSVRCRVAHHRAKAV